MMLFPRFHPECRPVPDPTCRVLCRIHLRSSSRGTMHARQEACLYASASCSPRRFGRRAAPIAALVLLAAGSATEFFLWAAPAGRAEHPVTQQSSGTESSLPVFELHSGFWVNLHHFLYLQARLMNGNSSSTDSGRGAAPPDDAPISLSDFPADEIRP